MYEKEMQRYNKKLPTSTFVCCANGGAGYPKEVIKRSWLEDNKQLDFEDTSFPGSVQFDDYMTSFYGEYMTLPQKINVIHMNLMKLTLAHISLQRNKK